VNKFIYCLTACFFIFIVNISALEKEDLTSYVNPMIGTDGNGHVFPGVVLPFGMVQLSPDNGVNGWDWASGYHFSSDTIVGFSFTHLSGTGVGDLSDISFMPTSLPINDITAIKGTKFLKNYAASFKHINEVSKAGYYSVIFNSSDIKTELTASSRCGLQRYTFPTGSIKNVVLNLEFAQNWDASTNTSIRIIDNRTISGYRFSKGWAPNQKVFFVAQFSEPFKSAIMIDGNGEIINNTDSISYSALGDKDSKGVKALFNFDTTRQIIVKVALSPHSVKGAMANLQSEIPDFNFEDLQLKAKLAWQNELNKVVVTDKSLSNKTIFYTALYHYLIHPSLCSDVNEPDRYSTFSLWDTYRAVHPLFTILEQEKTKDFLQSFLAHFRKTGLMPIWTLWDNEVWCMIGYHSVPVVVDAWRKGLVDSTLAEELYKGITTMPNTETSPPNQQGWDEYCKFGYYPSDIETSKALLKNWKNYNESASKTLEWSFDDYCKMIMAKGLDKKSDAEKYAKLSGNFKNIADSSIRFMRPKLANGDFVKPFSPEDSRLGNGFTEGNSWQYSFYVPHDIPWLVNFMGGSKAFANKLDTLFETKKEKSEVGEPLDASGYIGFYAHGNEPSHHIAYLYNYTNRPEQTAYRVNQIRQQMYSDKNDGLCGNDDCGQMSAWYVFSAMGFYPVNPVSGSYEIGTPLFDEVSVHLENGKTFNIIAKNRSDKNIYVDKIFLNGKRMKGHLLQHADIMKGGELIFVMKSGNIK